MIKKISYSLLIFIISLFLISTITFFLFEIVPGEVYDLEVIKSETVIKNIRKKYELDEPIFNRYCKMLKNTFTFDFGNSFINQGLSVNEIIYSRFPISAKIGIISIVMSLVNGTIIGYIIGSTPRTKKIFFIGFIVIISLPIFIIAALLQYLLSVKYKVFSILWTGSWKNYILPCISLSLYPTVFIARILGTSIEDVKNKDYVLAAKARNINEFTVSTRYIIKNAITPVLSYVGPLFANLLSGSFVVETIFNIPGLGRHFISSVTNRDYPTIMGLTIFYAILLIMSNFIVNMIIAANDYKGKRIENE